MSRRAFRKGVRRAKRESWKLFTEETRDSKAMSQLIKTMQGKENRSINLLSDATVDTPEGTVDHLLDIHFPGNTTLVNKEKGNPYFGKFADAQKKITYVSLANVLEAISSFGNNKAGGPDGIKPVVLKNLPLSLVGRIQAIYIASLFLGYVPACWRRSKVVFIPKPGRADYSKSKAFRPITLTSFLFKTMERVVLRHLETAHNVHDRLKVNQHAFRKGSSCNSALSDMVDGIESSILRNQFALGIFLDIKGAFDNLNVESSIQGMERKGLPPHIIKWYTHYLQYWSVRTEIKGITAIRTLTRGTPQGGYSPPLCGT